MSTDGVYDYCEILDVEDLQEDTKHVIVKTTYYNPKSKKTFIQIEIGHKDNIGDILDFEPLAIF